MFSSKVLSVRGKKEVGKLISGERGCSMTLMFCMVSLDSVYLLSSYIQEQRLTKDVGLLRL
jgi:hypothetical protein